MDLELMQIQMVQDFSELAEQYDSAVSNERLWAKGADDPDTALMHEQNAEHASEMAKFYRYLATRTLDLVETFQED